MSKNEELYKAILSDSEKIRIHYGEPRQVIIPIEWAKTMTDEQIRKKIRKQDENIVEAIVKLDLI